MNVAPAIHKRIILPQKIAEIFQDEPGERVMYRVAHGGRGSGKTRGFALMAALRAYKWDKQGRKGVIVCGREFQNSLKESSFAEVKLAIEEHPWLAEHFEIGVDFIRTLSGNITFSFIGLRKSLNSLKSTARILLLWVDEAETLTDVAWEIIDPTVREHDSEVWVTYNPALKESPTNMRFRLNTPPYTRIREVNWSDNPFFPDILDIKRQNTLREKPDQYEHIWEGAYVTVMPGAYYSAGLTAAKMDGRICNVPHEPMSADRIYCDLGGTGGDADHFVMVHCQFVGLRINILNHYEARGQEPGEHLGWLREWDLESPRTQIILPHDGTSHDKTTKNTWAKVFRDAGYKVKVMPRIERGAASQRIEAVRRLMPRMWFNEHGTEALRRALGWYHEKIDDIRRVGLGPDHDWASHSADATGEMALDYTEPTSGINAQVSAAKRDYEQGIDRSIL